MSKRTNAIILLAASGIVTMSACGTQPGGGVGGTANSAPIVKTEPAKAPSDKGDQVVTGGDLAFMNDAAPGGMAEVELGRMASKQATDSEVKRFAAQMITDHTKAGEELKQLAQGKKVMLPAEVLPAHKEVMEKLAKLNGAEFDREYVKAMVAAHEKDVTAFNATAQGATDADVKAFAAKTLPTLQMHLQMIKDLDVKMSGKAKP